MKKFSYKAINQTGSKVSGVIEAESLENANNFLANRGFIPSKVKEETKTSSESTVTWSFMTGIKVGELILFTKQFRTMFRAGIHIMRLLQILEIQTENTRLKKIISLIAKDVSEGTKLNIAFRKHPAVFSPLYCSVVQAGESSGQLAEVLDRLIYIMEHENKIKSDVKAALRYPMIVTFFLIVAFVVMLNFVVPTYVKVFVKAGIKLPLPTEICIELYNFTANYWQLIIICAIGGISAFAAFIRTPQGRFIKDFLILQIPVIGLLFIKAAMSRFASIFAILQASGIAVLDSMTILAGTIGNYAISREFEQIKDKIKQGNNISKPLKSAKYFTPMVVNMVAIGEESGRLDEMLKEITEHYDAEVEYATKGLSEFVGPLLTIGLAAVVGFFALAIFLPMWDLTKMVK